MAVITETFIKPEIFRPSQKAEYSIGDIQESELSDEVQNKLNNPAGGGTSIINVSTIIIGGLIPSEISSDFPALIGGMSPSSV